MLIVCCGMPRSASTLQFNIAWKIVETARIGRKVEWRSAADWDNAGEELSHMALSETMHVIKTHSPPAPIRQLAQTTDCVRFIYVHRDIRDVVVSMKVKFDFTLSRAIRRISESIQLERWLAEHSRSSVLVQDYQTLLVELPEAIEEISRYLGAGLTKEKIARISAELDIRIAYQKSRTKRLMFEHLRRRVNMVLGRKMNFADDELMLHPEHVSAHRGEIGIWKSSLTPEELAVIEKHFGPRIRSGFDV